MGPVQQAVEDMTKPWPVTRTALQNRESAQRTPIRYFSCVVRRKVGREARTGRRVVLATVLMGAVVALGACGGGGKQDQHDATGTFKVDVPRASFPGNQRLAQESTLEITVVNKDSREIPRLAVTVDGFTQRHDDPTLADPSRPIWIVNEPPVNADSALTNTWALGPVAPGQSTTFKWKVTPVRSGTYSVRYRIAVGLYGKAKVQDTSTGGAPTGSFIARVSRTPRPLPPLKQQRSGRA
jgi:hypothetical protein